MIGFPDDRPFTMVTRCSKLGVSASRLSLSAINLGPISLALSDPEMAFGIGNPASRRLGGSNSQ